MSLLEKQVLGSPSFHFPPQPLWSPDAMSPAMTNRDVSFCLDIWSAGAAVRADRGSPMSSLPLA